MSKIYIFLIFFPSALQGAESGIKLDKAKLDLSDGISIQRGAQTFVNYCLGCHEASYMRFNRMEDLGLTKQQIRQYLVFGDQKVGDLMRNSMSREDAQTWFGIVPPDLSVVARSRGGDWLYTYLRSFYRDDSTATGWNNVLFPNVGMPHILWEMQGVRMLKIGSEGKSPDFILKAEGTMDKREYDNFIRDLVNFLVYMGEPARTLRVQVGIVIMFILSIFLLLTYLLKKEFWKDVSHQPSEDTS